MPATDPYTARVPKPSKIAVVSYDDIGRRLRGLRIARGFTQTQLAELLGTKQTAVSEVERGQRGLTVQQLVKVARALGASPNEILAETSKAARQRPINAKILRRVRRLEHLPEPQQRAVLKLLDGIIAAHASS